MQRGLGYCMKQNIKLTIQDLALLGLLTATLTVGKAALAFIPNVEVVSLLIIVYSLVFGPKVLFSVFAFVLLEIFQYGLGIWTVMYLYIWPLLSLLTLLFRNIVHPLFWSIFSGLFGFLFGALCTIPYLFIGGPAMMLTWWLSGLPWDITHGLSNFFLCLILFIPLRALLKKLKRLSPSCL